MHNQKRKKKKNNFKKAFIIYISILIVLIAGTLVFLWMSLADYQQGIDLQEADGQKDTLLKRAPQLYFEEYLSNLNEETLTDLWFEENPDSLSQREDIENILKETGFFSSSYECFKASDYSENDPKYLVKTNGEPFMEVSLFGSGTEWSVYNVHFLISKDEESDSSYKVPSDTTLMINGIEVSKDNIEFEEAVKAPKDYEESLINPISFATYTLQDLLNDPVIEVTGTKPYILTELSPKEYCYILPEEHADSFIKKANDFVRSLLHYYTLGKQGTDENMNVVLSKVASSSQAFTVIKSSYDGVLWRYPYPNVTYDLTEGPVIVDADNCFHIDIHYETPNEEISEITSREGIYRVYFLDLGEGYKIYYFELIN